MPTQQWPDPEPSIPKSPSLNTQLANAVAVVAIAQDYYHRMPASLADVAQAMTADGTRTYDADPNNPWAQGYMAGCDDSARKVRNYAAIVERYAAQAAQAEPVAHICILPTKDAGPTKFFTAPSDPRGFPVYTAPPAAAQAERAAPVSAEVLAERERWTEAVMAELDGNGQAQAIVAYATRAALAAAPAQTGAEGATNVEVRRPQRPE